MDVKQAKSLAFGSKPSVSLEEYYSAWQWLFDQNIALTKSDEHYMDKLICDGIIRIGE